MEGSGRQAIGKISGGLGDAAEAFFEAILIEFPPFRFIPDLSGEAPVAFLQMDVDGCLPIREPGSDPVLKLIHGAGLGLAGLGRGHALDLHGEPLGFLTILCQPQFGFPAGRFHHALDVFPQRRERYVVVGMAVQHGGIGGGGGWQACFKLRDALFQTFEMAADDDFADTLDCLGRVEG